MDANKRQTIILRSAEEIVQTVMVNVITKQHPSLAIDGVASQIEVLLQRLELADEQA